MVCQMIRIPNHGMYTPPKNLVKILKLKWSKLMIWKIWSQHHGKPVSNSQNCIYQLIKISNTDKKSSILFRYTSAEVVDKEYCQAKKSENRFRVPQGTKFYRVRCKPATIKDKDIMTKSNRFTAAKPNYGT